MGKSTISTGPFSIAMFVYQRVNLLQHHKPNMFVNSTNLAFTVLGHQKVVDFWTGWVGSPRDLDRFTSQKGNTLGTNCKAPECSISCLLDGILELFWV